MAPLLVRVAEETDDNNNAKFMECVLYARDTMNALHVGHSSQMPCERDTVISPISQMQRLYSW